MRKRLVMAMALASALAATPAWAGLIGTNVAAYTYLQGDTSSRNLLGESAVSPTATFRLPDIDLFSFAVSDNSLKITSLSATPFTVHPDDVLNLLLVDNQVDFTSVTVDGQTSFADFDQTLPDGTKRTSFDPHQILVNLTNLTFQPDSVVMLDITASPITSVPEPVTLSLFAAGLAGAFATRRRKAQFGLSTSRGGPDES